MAKVNLEDGKTINITFDIKAVVLKNVFELMQTCPKADRCVCQKRVLLNLTLMKMTSLEFHLCTMMGNFLMEM